MLKSSKIVFRRGSAPDSAVGADDALTDSLMGWKVGQHSPLTTSFAPLRLRCLDPRRLGFDARRVQPKTLFNKTKVCFILLLF